eukprot:jgi/Chlat1/2333/Chrsp17S02618
MNLILLTLYLTECTQTPAVYIIYHCQQVAIPEDDAITLPTGQALPHVLKQLSLLSHLAVFSFVGVLIRYGISKLFGPDHAGITSPWSPLFTDLPENMLGSFLMGVLGVTLKKHIGAVSEHLLLGLTTGLLGSITTYSGWNQQVARMFAAGLVLKGFVAVLLGYELCIMSLVVGVHVAKALLHINAAGRCAPWLMVRRKDPYQRQMLRLMAFAAVFFMLLAALVGAVKDSSPTRKALWLSCAIGPTGVWLRWWLSVLNTREWGPARWFPLGTFLANASASATYAAISLRPVAVHGVYDTAASRQTLWEKAVAQGVLGNLSTVSTLVGELYNLRKVPWRVYAYAVATVTAGQLLALFIYVVPVVASGYTGALPAPGHC